MDKPPDNPRDARREARHTDAALRTYNYNSDDLQLLFANVIASLGSPEDPGEVVGHILTDVCRHFRFGCGFVYEADHAQTFHLKERYACYAIRNMPESFRLEKHLDIADIDSLLHSSVFYQCLDPDAGDGDRSGVFDSNTFMLVPAFNRDMIPIGLVGMMDRRHNILLDGQAVQAARMVLNLLANSIKIRIYQRNLEYAKQSLVNILDNAGVHMYVTDFETHEILYVNKSMAEPYGGRKNMLGEKCWKSLYSDRTDPCEYCPKRKLIDDKGNPTKVHSWDYRRPFDGAWFRVLSAAFRWVDGRLAHVVSSVDITENKKNEAIIAQMANYDALTNLPNRRKLVADCEEAMKRAESRDGGGYLLFFDLDDFKKLNDGMGHQAGDQLLAEIGGFLRENPQTGNHAYRYGGDEFILLYPDADREHVRDVARSLLARFDKPWRLAENNASPVCRASIGIARYSANGTSVDKLLHCADMMMYKAKRNGRGVAVFSDGEIVRPAGAEPGE